MGTDKGEHALRRNEPACLGLVFIVAECLSCHKTCVS